MASNSTHNVTILYNQEGEDELKSSLQNLTNLALQLSTAIGVVLNRLDDLEERLEQ